jgi:methylenetetrahydrofolate reductase (NADPH)
MMTEIAASAEKGARSTVQTDTRDELKARIVEFVSQASTEATAHDESLLAELPRYLPAGATVYVTHLPRTEFRDVVRMCGELVRLGLSPCPHIAARQVHSEAGLRASLNELRQAGVKQVLLIAGDNKTPAGPYTSAVEVLESGIIEDAAIKMIGVAGHPEGNRTIGPTRLKEALVAKQAYADRTGADVRLVTQFGFDPQAVLDWSRELREQGIRLPIHVGIAGPTPLAKLIRFAMRCGIGTSLNNLMRNASAMSNLTRMATTPDAMVAGIIRGVIPDPESRIVKPHFFCFGGLIETVSWINAVRAGSFDLGEDAGSFALRH